jgi:hypothetical protein
MVFTADEEACSVGFVYSAGPRFLYGISPGNPSA